MRSEKVKMATDSARWRFVLRFVKLDLRQLSRGDWYNLQDDLQAFFLPTWADVKPGGLHTLPTEDPRPENYPQRLFPALQAETYDLLAQVIASRGDPEAWQDKSVQISLTNPHLSALRSAEPGRHEKMACGAVRDLFLLRVWWLLGRVQTGRLTRCPACDAIFLPKQRQHFCSTRCTNRIMQQRHRHAQAHGVPVREQLSADPVPSPV